MNGSSRDGRWDASRPRPGFYGWWMVGLCAVATAMSAPGQTVGISVFIDPMIAALNLSRSEVSTAYLLATLASALILPRAGRLIDQFGSRRALMVVSLTFGAALVFTAGVRGFTTLAIAFFLIRLLGQGSLPLVTSTAVAPWFMRRRGFAIGAMTAIGASVMSLIPIGSAAMIRVIGWRASWLVLAVAVVVVLLPIAARGIVDRPSDIGQQPDGTPPTELHRIAMDEAHGASFSRREALRTPAFWVLAGAISATGAIGTGLKFHQIALLGEQGLSPIEAAANFLPQTAGVLLTTLIVGTLTDRIGLRWIIVTAMVALAGAMVAVPYVAPGLLALIYGLLLGSAGAISRVAEAAVTPKLYGLRELGAIRGVLRLLSVAASGLGPVALALGQELTGSYTATLTVLLIVPAAVALAALVTTSRPPQRPPPAA